MRLRCCEPLPHDLVHVDHGEKEEYWQLTAHAAMLQLRVSWRYGHAYPPYFEPSLITERLRLCAPVPHDFVHVDHAAKLDTMQWTAHGPCEHDRVSVECLHATPPKVGSTLVRLRDWKPLPHEVEHPDHAFQLPITQLMAHLFMLHERASISCGHALPPKLGCT